MNIDKNVKKFIKEKLSSKSWRLNNLYTIEDKIGNKKKLKLNDAQKKILKHKHNRKIILKSRQQGVSTLFLAYNLDSCIFNDGYSAGIQSYGLDESIKLQRRARLMWEEFPYQIKKLIGIKLVNNSKRELIFNNRSVLKIGNFRGDTLQSLHVSELGKIAASFPDKAMELKTGAFQAVSKDCNITIESTAYGSSGLFYDMWINAEKKKNIKKLSPFDFEPIFLSWTDDNDCSLDYDVNYTTNDIQYFKKVENELRIKLTKSQKDWYSAKKEELCEKFDQEYPYSPHSAFEQNIDGAYYANQIENVMIEKDLFDSSLPVHSAIDIGISDPTAVVFFQIDSYDNVYVIYEHSNSGDGLEHLFDVYNAVIKELGCDYGKTLVPHDIAVKEWITAKTRLDTMRELGFNPITVKKHRVNDGIEAVRQMLRNLSIDEKCVDVITSLKMYRRKYDKKFNILLDAPEHDKHSHFADAIRYMAMGIKYGSVSCRKNNNRYNHINAGMDI